MANIEWDNIVGEITLEKGGHVGDLLRLALIHLQAARDENQLSEGQVGEVYAGTINAAIAQGIQYEMTKDANLAMAQKAEAEAKVAVKDALVSEDDEYLQNRLNIVQAESDVAVAQAKKAETDSFIADELLIAEKEKNGYVGYDYVYKLKYYDYANNKHNLDPTYTLDEDGNKVYGDQITSYTEHVVLYCYKDGIGFWKEVQSESTSFVSTVINHYSYIDADNVIVNTKVDVRDNTQLVGDTYIILDSTGHNIVVQRNADSDEIPYSAVSGPLSSATDALRWKNGTVGDPISYQEWNDTYTDYINNSSDSKYSGIVSFTHAEVFADANNKNNFVTNVATEIGWDGLGDNPEGKPMTAHTFTYAVTTDELEIFEATRKIDGTGTDRLDSIVKLQKLEIQSGTAREEKKVSLSRLPSGR